MKRLYNNIILLVFINIIINIKSQSLVILQNGNYNLNGCSYTFRDQGDGILKYDNNTNAIYTFEADAFKRFKVKFDFIDIKSGDYLKVYNGPNTNSPLIATYNGFSSTTSFELLNVGKFITFEFFSDASTQGAGWNINLSCILNCISQDLKIDFANFTPIPETDVPEYPYILNLCGSNNFKCNYNTYFQTFNEYTINPNNSTIYVTYGDGIKENITTNKINHTYTRPGIYPVRINITDSIGCKYQINDITVVTASFPYVDSIVKQDTICQYVIDSVKIVDIQPSPFSPPILSAAPETFLPDILGIPFVAEATVNIYNDNATYDLGIFKGVRINMEHAYIGDLEILLQCPNGQQVTLKEVATGSTGAGSYLGEPVDDDNLPNIRGIGYDYYFLANSNTYGTMVNESGQYTYSYTDQAGNTVTNAFYLPSGSYTPFQDFNTNFIGCPINGIWKIIIYDHLPSDNGYIFNWEFLLDTINSPQMLDSTILPVIDSIGFVNDNPNITIINDYEVNFIGNDSGTTNLTFKFQDNYGCKSDTIIPIYVRYKEKTLAGNDIILCNDSSVKLNAKIFNDRTDFTWHSDDTINISFEDELYQKTNLTSLKYGFYNVFASELKDGCPTYFDSIIIENREMKNTINLNILDNNTCIGNDVLIKNKSDMTQYSKYYVVTEKGNTYINNNSIIEAFDRKDSIDIYVKLSDDDGCYVDSTIINAIIIERSPYADFSYNPSITDIPKTNINFINSSTEYDSLYWYIDDLYFGNSEYFTYNFKYLKQDTSVVKLVVKSGNCIDSVIKTLIFKEKINFFVPNSFTPNDDGINETFKLYYSYSQNFNGFRIYIFNRNGEEIFYSEDPYFVWDGKYKNDYVPNGVYIFSIQYKDENQDFIKKIGEISILK